MPSDPRSRRMADRLVTDPSDRTTLAEWARELATSERTLLRVLSRETGVSFVRWRQRFQIVFALKRLAEGASVQTIAYDLGYESSSAFVTMFRRTLGKPPMKFLADRAQDGARAGSSGRQ